VVVGVGVNLTWPGPPEADGTSILALTGTAVPREAFLDAYLDALAARDRELRSTRGRVALAQAYRSRLETLGRRVAVQLHDDDFVGIARDVTDQGNLVVVTDEGTRVVAAGDVVHLRAAPQGGARTPE
jgi:BirA family transcriptional regulator, biotin operon repressor / biotin---[acetyl-CoA-carboxylase] ligase